MNNIHQVRLSGHDGFNKPITLTTPYAVNATKGFTFHPKRLREIVPGKIFNLSGFEFTEYYFIVSKDGSDSFCASVMSKKLTSAAVHCRSVPSHRVATGG